MEENLLEIRKGTEDLCLRKYFGPRGLSAATPGLYTVPVKNQQHISLFSEDPKLFFSEKQR